jgi:hypothetical protein
MEIVVEEILRDKIYLDTSNQLRVTGELTEITFGPGLDFENL